MLSSSQVKTPKTLTFTLQNFWKTGNTVSSLTMTSAWLLINDIHCNKPKMYIRKWFIKNCNRKSSQETQTLKILHRKQFSKSSFQNSNNKVYQINKRCKQKQKNQQRDQEYNLRSFSPFLFGYDRKHFHGVALIFSIKETTKELMINI